MSQAEGLLAQLDERQRAAVVVPGGPVLVLAGPGSGKTRVLTHRVAYVISALDIPPWQIMAVTFTNKAAREMRARLATLLGESALDELTVGTFHAICARVLRREAALCGLDSRFVIYDADDQLRLMRRVLAQMEVDTDRYVPAAVLDAISRAKNELVRPQDYVTPSHWHEVAARAYEHYQAELRALNALDFDDLLMETALLLETQPGVASRYQDRFRHVVVDEFQDTNSAQYAILRQLVAASQRDRPHNLFVVGDEDQSIYRWRGADYRHIGRFLADFPDAVTVLLERNYRSTQNILDAARAVIERNPQRTAKRLWTDVGTGSPITVFEAQNPVEEAEYIALRIEAELGAGAMLGEMAVMYRTNAQSRSIEEALLRHRLPYQLVGATRFYERREIRDVLAYLRLAHNPLDDVALERIINVPPRGIGATTWRRVSELATELGIPRWSAIQELVAGSLPDASELLDRRSERYLRAFAELIGSLIARRSELAPSALLACVLAESGYAQWLRDGSSEGEERWENIGELLGVAREFDTLPPQEGLLAFLESAALVSDTDNLSYAPDRVTLLTLHAAKGLEFRTVFLAGLEEGLLPHSRSLEDAEALAEERRLFYVGITRARERLYLVHAFRRRTFGSEEPRQRSRFLDDLPPHVLASPLRPAPARARAVTWSAGKTAPARDEAFRAGDRVRHPQFGVGIVVTSRACDGDQEVVVAFDGYGVRRVMQHLAEMERLPSRPRRTGFD